MSAPKRIELQHLVHELQNGISKRRGDSGEAVPVLRLADIKNGQLDEGDLREIALTAGEVQKYGVCRGDVLAIRVNGSADLVGRLIPCVNVRVLAYCDHLIRIRRRSELVDFRYLTLFGGTTAARKHLSDKSVTTAGQRTINQGGLSSLVVAVPPLAEQKRIVAKVDQLMALCDDLEARQAKKRDTAVRLNRAALDALTTAEGPEAVAASFQRIAENFEALVHAPESVSELRKTVLGLAARGKLVAQDPKAVSASAVLEAVARRRETLSRTRRVSTSEVLPAVTVKEQPYPAPPGWLWARFADVTVCRDGERIPVSKEERAGRKGPFDYYGASGVIDSVDGFLFEGPLLLIGEDGANLINRSTPIAFIAAGQYWVNNHAHVLDGAGLESLRYLAVFINAIDLRPYITGTAQPKMNQAKMNSIPIAVPPLEEQKRIVAKVDQLMALCDSLEAALRHAETTAQKLAAAVVAEIVA